MTATLGGFGPPGEPFFDWQDNHRPFGIIDILLAERSVVSADCHHAGTVTIETTVTALGGREQEPAGQVLLHADRASSEL